MPFTPDPTQTYVDLGAVDAIVFRPTASPPDDTTRIWAEQYDNDFPEKIRLRIYDFELDEWILLKETGASIIRAEFTVASNGQTIFALPEVAIRENLSELKISGLPNLMYGIDYTISGSTLTFIPNGSMTLKENDIVEIKFYF